MDNNQQSVTPQPEGTPVQASTEETLGVQTRTRETAQPSAEVRKRYSDRDKERYHEEVSLTRQLRQAREEADRLIIVGKQSGLPIDAEAEQRIRVNAIMNVLYNAEPAASPLSFSQRQSQPERSSEGEDEAQEIADLMEAAGAVVEENDPEFKLIDGTNIKTLRASAVKAAKAKAQRMGNTPDKPLPALPVQASGGTSQTAETLAEEYKREAQTIRGKGMRAAEELKAKYRQKGLDVDSVSLYR